MKKIIIIPAFIALMSIVFNAAGQEGPVNKSGELILPQKGSFGLGMNAIPFLNYLKPGDNTSNNYLGYDKFVSIMGSNVFFCKYMISPEKAYRAHFRIYAEDETYKNLVYDDTSGDPDSLVTDKFRTSSLSISLGGGYEIRKTRKRLQGIFGGEAFVSYVFYEKNSYRYGNAYGTANVAPTSTTWYSWGGVNTSGPLAERELGYKGGGTYGFGIRPFIGVEYFVLPGFSIGTEFGWSLGYYLTERSISTVEYYDYPSQTVLNKETRTAGSSRLYADTDNMNGSIYFMVYF